MECINHPGAEAAGTCQICGKALCPSCLNRFDPPLCEPCLLFHNASVARSLYIDLAVTFLIFAAVAIFIAYNVPTNKSGGIFAGLVFAGAYWGWQFISRVPMPVILTSGFGLIIYFAIKFSFAVVAGIFVAPWQIFRRIKEITAINKLKKEVSIGQA